MKGFFSWFNSKTKIKRWMFLILVGICFTCYAFASILDSKVLKPRDIIEIVVAFVLGFTVIVIGFIFMQKRVLEILIEANNTSTEKGKKANLNIKGLIFNKTMYDEGPKIVVIGGGNGLNTVIKGLKKYTNNITAIVNMGDDNSSKEEKISRKEWSSLPYGEIKECIIALSDQEDLMRKLFYWQFQNKRLNKLNFGDVYLEAMNEMFESTSVGLRKSTEILNITGQVLPTTLDEFKVCAELADGSVVESKENIPEVTYDKITKIRRIYISPSNCRPAPGVIEAIRDADAIIIGPGSLYTDVLPNLLVKNVSKEIKESKAIKIYITNLMTEPGQTDNYTVSDHIEALFSHTGKEIIDYCLVDTGEIVPEYVRKYNLEGQEIVLQDIDRANKKGVKIIQKNLSKIEGFYIRHNSDVIASSIMELICNDLKFRDKESTPEYLLVNSILEDELKRERKINKKLQKQNKKNKVKRSKSKGKGKFNTKYRDRIESIQATDKQKIANQKLYKQMEKLNK